MDPETRSGQPISIDFSARSPSHLRTTTQIRRPHPPRIDGPNPVSARRAGHRYHLGDNEEVFDAEVFAIYQALRTFEARNEEGAEYTVSSDSTAA